MSPDSNETRLGRLETAVARLEARTDDLSTDVRTLTPLIVQVAEIKITMNQVQAEAHATKDAVDQLTKTIERRRDDERKDSRSLRNILIGVGVAAVLSPVGGIMVALAVGKP